MSAPFARLLSSLNPLRTRAETPRFVSELPYADVRPTHRPAVALLWLLPLVAAYAVGHQALHTMMYGESPLPVALDSSLIPLSLVGMISWSVWLSRWLVSRRYRPVAPGYRASTSVLVPCYREDPEVLHRCLDTWLANEPDEVVLVVDVADTDVLAMLADEFGADARVRVIEFPHDGKRSAMGVAARAASHDIFVFADSDTAWEPGLLAAVLAPFADPRVGGVGTRQNVYLRGSSAWRVLADWQVNTRYLDYVPAESRAGAVACLSGRTAAYRREAVLPVLADLEHEKFLGRQCIAGDDGRLTWLVLKDGWRTVYQSNARAISMFPGTARAYFRQRIRWSRNSYRCYLTAAWKGWLWRMPFATQVRVLQILATPLTQTLSLVFIGWFITQHAWALAALATTWLFLSRAIRSISHLCEHPGDLRYLPAVTLAVIVVALPVKAYAFVTMNRQGWLTRTTTSRGGEGQSEASLRPRIDLAPEAAAS